MDVKAFITGITELASRYKAWWYPPFEKFRAEYSKEHPDFDYQKWSNARSEFETNLRNQSDLLSEIHNFIDQNYEVYLNATQQECKDIRDAVTNCYYMNKGKANRFLEDLFFRYAKERAIPKLQQTGDKIWLTRGLVAMSIENSGIDYRDSILALRDLQKAALEKNIDPKPEFARIAQISSIETPRGGSIPMSKLMAK